MHFVADICCEFMR